MNEHLQELVDERTADLIDARDRAVAASGAKSTFVANMSHELRTPLNAIIGYSEMIIEDGVTTDPTLISDVLKIHGAGKHLLTLVNDVLDLAKVEAGKMSIFREPVDLRELVDGVVGTLHPLLKATGGVVAVEVLTELGTVVTDAVRLRQVLFNLLSNAMKFSPGGTVTLRVSRDDAARRVLFEVEDTGIGIPRAQLDKLFVPFMQADPSSSRAYEGTGLGLALAQRICSMLGGSISVDSEERRGSTFKFWLPAGSESEVPEASTLPLDPEGVYDTVLVIDDDDAVHDLVRRHLAPAGLQVVATVDATQALSLARSVLPVAIALDVLMPRVDGWAVLKQLKEDPILARIPVIMLSACDERDLGLALGAADYLVKPVTRALLVETVRRHMRVPAQR